MITLDTQNPTPPYEQIREQITGLVRSGTLGAHHRLPSIRQLAGDLRIAPGTVARAYKELEAAGLISSGRAAGTRVCADQQVNTDLHDTAAALVAAAKQGGSDLAEALSAVRSAWALADG